MMSKFERVFLHLGLLTVATSASAHDQGQAAQSVIGSFYTGLAHPVLGPDHFLAMLAVGILAASRGQRDFWAIPSVFVLAMAFGGLLGMLGVPFAPVEIGISLSVVLLGLAILSAKHLDTRLLYGIIGLFGAFHGYAHGSEMPEYSSPFAYGTGFILGTAAIHVFGLLIGDILKNVKSAPSLFAASGIGFSLAGTWFLFASTL